MLTEICAYLNNYFEYEKKHGTIKIEAGVISCNGEQIALETGQHFALFRGRIPLGVFTQGETLTNKTFEGSVWLMDVPRSIEEADTWAKAWMAENGAATAAGNSAYQSESFGGYSYNKGTNAKGKAGTSIFDNAQFAAMLAPYRKLR